jgi:hypothetical protein
MATTITTATAVTCFKASLAIGGLTKCFLEEESLLKRVFCLDGNEKPISAFIFAERLMTRTYEVRDRTFELETPTAKEKFCKITKLIGIVLFGMTVALPVMAILTPLTVITDIAVGIIGSIYMAYKGEHSYEVISEFAYQKIVYLPVEQLVNAIMKYGAPITLYIYCNPLYLLVT